MLRRLLAQNNLNERVYFGGHVTQDEPATFLPGGGCVSERLAQRWLQCIADGSLSQRAAGLVSDIPGNQEWIAPGVQGWLFPDGNEDALVEGILQAYRQRSRLAELGKASRRLAEQRADWTENFKGLLKAYDLATRMGIK